jgi:hypothetical protein
METSHLLRTNNEVCLTASFGLPSGNTKGNSVKLGDATEKQKVPSGIQTDRPTVPMHSSNKTYAAKPEKMRLNEMTLSHLAFYSRRALHTKSVRLG